ncbi:sulfite reductase flavoprotein subunit alpha [Chlamydiia bacterium]|nr:sulfite reductase flavoprotein subunit alpha [Chlamydiia bacterium]
MNITKTQTYTRHNPCELTVISRQQLTTGPSQRHMFEVIVKHDDKLSYKLGDSIGIFPKNSPEKVNFVIDVLGLSPSYKLYANKTDEQPITLYQYLLMHVDINDSTNLIRDMFPDYSSEYISWEKINNQRCNKSDAITIVKSLKKIAPRFYSISSSPHSDEHIHLTIRTDLNKNPGLCSTYLCHENKQNETVYGFIHPTRNFTFQETDKPVIMIGPGTGIAPFVGYIKQQLLYKKSHQPIWLFFGDRKKSEDMVYEALLEKAKNKINLKLSLAFSRDQSDKIYVQDLIWKERQTIFKWMNDNAIIYICGDASQMAKDVLKTLAEVYAHNNNIPIADAEQHIKSLKRQKQIRMDVY